MRKNSLLSNLLIFFCASCVDRIDFDLEIPNLNVVINGYISDQPGPYTVKISSAFDVQSKLPTNNPITVKQVVISDNKGYSEVLSDIEKGIYQTKANGIRGKVGGVYAIRVELFDGRVYESMPDTLLNVGSLDSVYYSFREDKTPDGASLYGFDIYFNSSAAPNGSYQFLYKFKGTYQVKTNPQLHRESCALVVNCPTPNPCGCPSPLPCSGYILKRGTASFELEYERQCECCNCWVDIYNNIPLTSDKQLVKDGHFTGIKATYIPITQYTFMYKMFVEVSQLSVTRQSFRFWKAISDQKNSFGSLFQPVSGGIPVNFTQITGRKSPSAQGLFYATAINSKAIYIRRNDIPNQQIIPQGVPYPFVNKKEDGSCLDFPFSTNKKPPFWID